MVAGNSTDRLEAAVAAGGTVLVTGATGFIGRVLMRQLQQPQALQPNKYKIKILLHRGQLSDAAANSNHAYCGSLQNSAVLDAACTGVDTVFHLAAHTHVNHTSREDVYRINVHGTAQLLAAAERQGVKRIVYFSSSLADENAQARSVYGDSKREAEELLLQAMQKQRIEVCCLRPVNVYGPGMKGNLMSMIKLINKGLFPPLPDSPNRISLVGVEDLCQAAILAARLPQANGMTYTVTDGIAYSMQELERAIRKALHRSQPNWTSPDWLLHAVAWQAEIVARLFPRRNLPGLQSYRTLTGNSLHSNEKISHELGYTPQASFFTELPQILRAAQMITNS